MWDWNPWLNNVPVIHRLISIKSKTAKYTSTHALRICYMKSKPNDSAEEASACTLYSGHRISLEINNMIKKTLLDSLIFWSI